MTLTDLFFQVVGLMAKLLLVWLIGDLSNLAELVVPTMLPCHTSIMSVNSGSIILTNVCELACSWLVCTKTAKGHPIPSGSALGGDVFEYRCACDRLKVLGGKTCGREDV